MLILYSGQWTSIVISPITHHLASFSISWWRENSINWQENTQSTTETKAFLTASPPMMPVLEVAKKRILMTRESAWVRTARVNRRYPDLAERGDRLNISVTFPNKEASCTANIYIILVSQRFNIRRSSICADCSLFHLILSRARVQPSCCRTASSRVFLPWWLSPRREKRHSPWCARLSSSLNNKQGVLATYRSPEMSSMNPDLTKSK